MGEIQQQRISRDNDRDVYEELILIANRHEALATTLSRVLAFSIPGRVSGGGFEGQRLGDSQELGRVWAAQHALGQATIGLILAE
jgi:hypothetical protein